MNKEVKKKWLERLRSGEIRQGMGYLNQVYRDDEREYCCLGVLCEIAVEEGIVAGPFRSGVRSSLFAYGSPDYFQGTQFPPREVTEWAGLNVRDPAVTVTDEHEEPVETTLSELNDEGKTFEEIADIIDEQL